jgi:2-dehydropantoate 2-reductase
MKIAVIGPGAVGCLLGAYLSRANQVWLLDHRPERAARLDRQGLVLERAGHREVCRIGATVDSRLIGPVDLALLCVKSGKVQDALRTAAPLFNRDSLLLALQNGIDHLAVLPELLGSATTWGLGITANGATLRGPGHVRHLGRGLTRIGLPPNPSPHSAQARQQLARAAAILTAAGLATEPVADIHNHIWAKLLVNIGINALTAIHDCPNGALLEAPATLAMMRAAVREGRQVAEKIGIVLADDPLTTTLEVCRATAANISSMLQDVRAGRPTEIEAINGALIRKAAELGLATPVNTELVRQIKAIEQGFLEIP